MAVPFSTSSSTILLILILTLRTEISDGGTIVQVPSLISKLVGAGTGLTMGVGEATGISKLITSIGLMGPAALGIMSKAGLALGFLGTATIARDAANLLSKYKDEREEEDYNERRYQYNPYHSSFRREQDYEDYNPHYNNHYNQPSFLRAPKERDSYNYEYDLNPYQSSYTHYRRRRSIRNNKKHHISKNIPNEDLFIQIYEADTTHCGERLICELGAKPSNMLKSDEFSIIQLIRHQIFNKREKSEASVARFPYKRALINGKNGEPCSSIYKKCPFDSEEMMSFVRLVSDKYIKEPFNKQ